MKTTLTPVVGIDFISSEGVRVFSFSLCSKGKAVAIVDRHNGVTWRFAATRPLRNHRSLIERVASQFEVKSQPARFGGSVLTAHSSITIRE